MTELVALLVLAALGLYIAAQTYFLILQTRYPEPAHADELHTVTTEDGWQLCLHRRKPASGLGEPVFFMHSLASNHLNFEVPFGFSLVDYLSKAGYDCWTFDSRACRDSVPPKRGLRSTSTVDDILVKDIPVAIETICKITGYDRVHWIGHSMGGMLLYAYDGVFGGNRIASGVTLGAPPGFTGYRHESHAALIALNRVAFPVLSFAFRGLAPYYYIWRPKSRLVPINWDNVHPKMRAREIFHAVEMPLPGIGTQMDGWASGKPWVMGGGKVNIEAHLSKLRMPLLAIFGGIDPFISQTRAQEFFNNIENADKRMIFLSRALGDSANYNHIELVFSVESEREVFAPIRAWLGEHPIRRTAPLTQKKKPVRAKKAAAPAPDPRASNVHLSKQSPTAPARAGKAKAAPAKKKAAAKKKGRNG